jgi:hypothetical protein
MKKIFILTLAILGLAHMSFAQKVWTGLGSDNNFSTAANWDDNVSPLGGNNESYLFDATSSKFCQVDEPIDALSFSVMPGYNGQIDMGSDDHYLYEHLVVNSGTLVATTGQLSFDIGVGGGGFSLGGSGTFLHNSGLISVSVLQNQVFTFSGNLVLNTLEIQSGGTGTTVRDVNFGSNLQVNELLLSVLNNRPFSYHGTVHIQDHLDLSGALATNVTVGTASFVINGTTPLITGAANATRARLPHVVINTTGTYAMTGQINVMGNWTGTQGTLADGTSTVNLYGSSATVNGPEAAFNNLTIPNNAHVTLPANSEVKISRGLTRTGTLTVPPTTALGLNGSGAQTIGLNGLTLAAINCYGPPSGTRNVTLSGTINILDSLKVGDNVNLATGGGLTLKANNPIKARFAMLGNGSSVSGNVTVETLIPGGTTGWSQIGVSGVQSQVISSWDRFPTQTDGLPMTCHGCTYGISSPGGNFYSIQGWNENTDTYDTAQAVINSGTPLTPGRGFWVYVGSGPVTSTDIKLINTGALVSGPVTVPVTRNSSGYNLVANPYACPINWDVVHNYFGSNVSDISPAIYTYDPDNGDSYFIADGVGGMGIGGLATGVLAAGQGFYAESMMPSGVLEFGELAKVTSQNTGGVLKSAGNVNQSFRLKVTGAADSDEQIFRFMTNASSFFDVKYDARKVFRTPGYMGYGATYEKYTSISSKDLFNEDYAIHSMPPLTHSLSIPVLVRVSATGSYTLSAHDFKNFNSCVALMDKVTNTYHDLKQSDYVFSMNDTTSSPRFELLLCRDENFATVTGISEVSPAGAIQISQDQESAFVRTAFPQATKATISAYNLIGQKLMDDIEVTGTATETRLPLNTPNQVVLIRVVTDKESSVKKMVIH